jgi:Rrf2 family protein
MKLSVAAEFAVRGVMALAEGYGPEPVKLDVICAQREVPRTYLAKIFGSLTRAGLVEATRGKRGGYRLARRPGQITVLEVIEAVEGPIVLNFCQHDPPQCERLGCPMRPVWAEIQRFVRGKLSAMTLADCVTRVRRLR